MLLAFNAPFARAQWAIALADAPPDVIRGTDLYSASASQRLATGDIVESGKSGIVLLQDDAGNVMALGPGTQILIGENTRISLLRGWLKIAHQCAAAGCPAPAIETERGTVDVGDHAAAIVAALAVPDPLSEVFSESGVQRLEPPGKGASTDSVAVAEGQFATISANTPAILKPRPSPAFLDGMPIPFRDALIRVVIAGKLRDNLSAPIRPVTFDDVSPWLTSALPARNQAATRFADRFQPRLADAAFKQQVEQNATALPEWQAAAPAPKPVPETRVAQKSTTVRSGPVAARGGVALAQGSGNGNGNGNAGASAPIAASGDSGNWFTRLFGKLHH
jgi:hypothetical protein